MDDSQTAARWVSAWSTSPIDASLSEAGVLDRLGVAVTDVSARTAVQLTAGGTHVRLTLSNIFGVLPLHVAACTIALGADDAHGIDPATLRTVTFGGKKHVRIPAGESCTSDPAALPVTAGQTLSVTVFYRGINAMRTIGLIGGCSHAEIGNCTRRPMLHMAVPMQHTADSGAYEVIPALTEVDVLAAAGTHACVIFGDSTVANELPRLLAARLRADGIQNVSVTQAAIKGDRLVADGVGHAAKLLGGAGVKRFGRDVLGCETLWARRARSGGRGHGARETGRERSHPPALHEQTGTAGPGHVRTDDGGLPRTGRHGARAGRAHLVLRAHAVERLHAQPLRPRGRHPVVAGI